MCIPLIIDHLHFFWLCYMSNQLILFYIYFNKLLFLQKQEAAKTLCTTDILNQDWDQLSHCMNSYFKAARVKQILLDLLSFGSYDIWGIDIVILKIFSKIGRSKIKMWALFVHSINQNHLILELPKPPGSGLVVQSTMDFDALISQLESKLCLTVARLP